MTLISTQTRKEKVFSNISLGLSRLTKSGQCYTPEELEKRRKEIGKGTVTPWPKSRKKMRKSDFF